MYIIYARLWSCAIQRWIVNYIIIDNSVNIFILLGNGDICAYIWMWIIKIKKFILRQVQGARNAHVPVNIIINSYEDFRNNCNREGSKPELGEIVKRSFFLMYRDLENAGTSLLRTIGMKPRKYDREIT